MFDQAVLNQPLGHRAWGKVVVMATEAQRRITETVGGQLGMIVAAALVGAALSWGAKTTDAGVTTNSQLAAVTVQITSLQNQVSTLQSKLDRAQADSDARYVSQAEFASFMAQYKDNHSEAQAWRSSQERMNQDLSDKLSQILQSMAVRRQPAR